MSSSPYGNDAHCHSDGLPGDAETLEAAEMQRLTKVLDMPENSKPFFGETAQTLPPGQIYFEIILKE